MDRTELAELARELDADDHFLAVTVTAPVDRRSPDPGLVRVRALARDAAAALPTLRSDVAAEARDAVVARLEDLEDEVTRQLGATRGEGVACYVTPSLTRVVRLADAPRERVVVNSRFWLAEAILDPHDDVDVVVLSSGGGRTAGARRYRLHGDGLTEVVDDVLPYEHDVRDHGERHKDEPPDQEKRDAYLEGFLNQVDRHLVGAGDDGSHRPVVLIGVADLRGHFARVRSDELSRRVVAEVDGNVDRAPDSALTAKVRAALAEARARAAEATVAEFLETPPVRSASGRDEVHAMATEGRVHRLLVERGASDETEEAGVVVEDRIAETVRAAYDGGAEVVAVAPGALGGQGPLGAIARW